MKTYKTLLFDIDDTLLDFGATEEVALQRLFKEQQLELTDKIKTDYRELNEYLWKEYEKGNMERAEVLNTRFSRLFEKYGIAVDGVALERTYRTFLSEGHHLMEGALDLIKDLFEHFDLYIVTNGESSTQFKRLKDAGLDQYFKQVFVSEDTGFQKPMKEFFDYVFSHIDQFDRHFAMIIGDSLSADIKGGWGAGIDTCWVNAKAIENQIGVQPTYEIRKLAELYDILNIRK